MKPNKSQQKLHMILVLVTDKLDSPVAKASDC